MYYNHSFIASTHNMRVKQWSSLLDKKYRDRTGQFIIEGIHLIQEALKEGAQISVIVYDADKGIPAELRESVYREAAKGIEWVKASAAVLAKCTGTDSAPPIFAVVSKLNHQIEMVSSKMPLVVVLDGIRDPGNAGTIIRSCDAAGADAVILGKGCVDLYNPKTVRSTMGSLFHLPIIEADLTELLAKAKEHQIKLVGTSLQASYTCYSFNWQQPVWLIMGSEADGVSPKVEAMMDETLIIPMAGKSESLNVAMASTILLFEAMRQRGFSQ